MAPAMTMLHAACKFLPHSNLHFCHLAVTAYDVPYTSAKLRYTRGSCLPVKT
jgi:hypothetical protein